MVNFPAFSVKQITSFWPSHTNEGSDTGFEVLGKHHHKEKRTAVVSPGAVDL